ncbi:carbon-nitrogen hydrolase [Aureliella helgolandensis]|uniref:N-carbamoyl-D-amino acid hydrolase n=1 Tax=Aureliella helgolandensis TaxID=2527968 RepID=A0A518G0R2_9BACT|nr:carbon-nitrogen hydrolase [Aureliella helgolandensis]QDV22191.1 N-carbamoyl-D-amino acid hydrolase [Aureliella helgolandensis]
MAGSKVVNLALVQMTCSTDKRANVDKAVERIAQAAAEGAHIVCLQEVFNTQYPCQSEDHANFDLAEEIPGPTSRRLEQAAKQHGVVVTCSIFERRTHGLYHNTALTYDVDGRLAGFYRKMHIPDDPLYYEKFYFTPGDTGFTIAETKYGKLGVGVCWDQWYPEAARLFALRGAEILLYPTAIGWIPEERAEYGEAQHSSWETAMRAHAIANGVFVGAPNRVGVEGGLQFWGSSFVANPNGTVLHRASSTEEEIVIVPCDLAMLDVVRTHWPFLRDRRVDAYQDITKRFIDASSSTSN